MRDICKNAYNFQHFSRGQNLHPRSGLGNDVFGYDFNGRGGRRDARRDKSCPDNWKDSHRCPEADQRAIMRQDGQWFTNALEPDTTINQIMDLPSDPVQYSGLRYTCDEFPPATWVEGGAGENNDSFAETRCAAFRCMAGYKGEQNWQALAHSGLRRELFRLVKQRNAVNSEFSFYRARTGVVLFKFAMSNSPDGVAARVLTYTEDANGAADVLASDRTITQAKRNGIGNSESSRAPRGLWDLTWEKIRARVDEGYGSAHIILANGSAATSSARSGSAMPHMGSMDDICLDERTCDGDEIARKPEAVAKRHLPRPGLRSVPQASSRPLLEQATTEDLREAYNIIDDAVAEASRRNAARLAQPLPNRHQVTHADNSTKTKFMPLLRITDKIANAAALDAEAHAARHDAAGNLTRRQSSKSGDFWMEHLARKGTVPWGDDPDYVVFRNVRDYGAVGDGKTDDTKAIKAAMNQGNRCGEKCNGSTTKNAIVYFPPGDYMISSTIPMPFGTQVIGDANTRPTLTAAPRFVGLGVLSNDEYTGGVGGAEEWFTNTANFYRQIRNIVIDITPAGPNISCLHYQVAQATSLQNVKLIAQGDQIGMFAENGSGGQISDVTFVGGIGFYGGAQQFTAQRLTFIGCSTAVHLLWDWAWVWKSINMTNVGVGFRLVPENGSGNVGSLSVIDSSFSSVGTAIMIVPASSAIGSGSTGLLLENVKLSSVEAAVADTAGKVYLDGSVHNVNEWAWGPVYTKSTTDRSFANGEQIGNYQRSSTLVDSGGAYFERQKPQYEDRSVGDFVHVKDMGVKGDGSTDDTAALQAALYASLGKVLFVDAGTYLLTSTVIVPPGAKIVGETWSQLVATGSYFADASNPKVLLQVGTKGSLGDVEMQDLIFTTLGATAGAILVEWNIQAQTPGSAGLWDCHARIGGATGTKLTPAECPSSKSGIDGGCNAGSLMMHLTPGASGYFENMWLWAADHMIECVVLLRSITQSPCADISCLSDPNLSDPANNMEQCSIYVARGFLIESTHPTWLYATASEHSIFYQYNFHGASNVFAGLLQTESPYFQPTPPPPEPFAAVVGGFVGDPDYTCAAGDETNGCDEAWSVIITESEGIVIAGAGIYSWFSTYSQTCVDNQQCQKTLVQLNNNYGNVRLLNLVTIGAKNMVVMNGNTISAADNINVKSHPFFSQLTILDVSGNGTKLGDLVWVDPSIWAMDTPSITCVPPCHVKLPPWTGATSTVDYPLMTVSNGTWTSTVTIAPLTISEWVLQVATVASVSGKLERRLLPEITPTLATTPYWPAITFVGNDGVPTTTAPSVPFPTPPPDVLPQRDVQPIAGVVNQPTVPECDYFDFLCIQKPWLWGDNITSPDSDPGDDPDEHSGEDATTCPVKSKTSTTTEPASAPTPSPMEQGDPMLNKVNCYNSGETTENERMQNAASSFCGQIKNAKLVAGYFYSSDFRFPYNGGAGIVDITISLEINDKCDWTWNENECKKYLSVPTDSCNCGGENGKQGGVVSNNCYTWRIDPNRSLS
ncbi:glycoside hydrolase family 55 protein [Teratosphaeria destructans]|uniref:Glycoside hydrolase family 55 protein n=1 Tax=Teratosphaeria destructans TaxID=418781 RepID=A0A9W7W7N2_9PEZI|nr:glycoside hydrolase family 55 protein [Teratosphaeria destructans]